MTALASAGLVAATLLTGGGLLLATVGGPVTEPAAVVDSPRPTAAGPVAPAPGVRYVWPLGPAPVVLRGFSPGPHRWSPAHRGVDLSATAGQQVLAAGDGEVTFAGPLAGRGVVVVRHADGIRTTYEPVDTSAVRGQAVRAGDPLGTLGAAGWHCSTACLHWGALRGDGYLDPLGLLTRRRPPVLLPLDPPLALPPDLSRHPGLSRPPVTGSPAAGIPATGIPATGSPATGSPATGSPATGSPAIGSPATGSPATGSDRFSGRSGDPPDRSGHRPAQPGDPPAPARAPPPPGPFPGAEPGGGRGPGGLRKAQGNPAYWCARAP